MVAPSQGIAGGGAGTEDGSVELAPPRMGGVEFVRERKFMAGPEGSTEVGGLVVNNKINSIICDAVERRK